MTNLHSSQAHFSGSGNLSPSCAGWPRYRQQFAEVSVLTVTWGRSWGVSSHLTVLLVQLPRPELEISMISPALYRPRDLTSQHFPMTEGTRVIIFLPSLVQV